jgi:hypothetical protein
LTALLLAARAENAKKQEQRLTSQNSPPSEDIAAADLEPSAVELPPKPVPRSIPSQLRFATFGEG